VRNMESADTLLVDVQCLRVLFTHVFCHTFYYYVNKQIGSSEVHVHVHLRSCSGKLSGISEGTNIVMAPISH
jgi:hypothetical protein